MTPQAFIRLGDQALDLLKSLAPYKTGNLRRNAIRIERPDANTFVLYVNEDIAPYMPYTNEVWEQKLITMGNFVKGQTVQRMRTWKNPNEGWFDRAARAVAEFVAEKMGGKVEK